MKKVYAIIDRTIGDWYEDVFETLEEATRRAEYQFNHLTEYDLSRTEYFALMYGELDEDDFFDLNTAEEIKVYFNKRK